MGQCKICGTEIEEGKEMCDSCQQDLEQVDIDMDNIGDIDINLEEFELPELSGELMESDLEFELDDPNNNLENPDIFVHDMLTDTPSLEELLPYKTLDEEQIGIPEEPVVAESVAQEPMTDLPDLPDLPEDRKSTRLNSSH